MPLSARDREKLSYLEGKRTRVKGREAKVAAYHEQRRQEASRLLGRQVDHPASVRFWEGFTREGIRQAEEATRPKPPDPHYEGGRLTAAGATAIFHAENAAGYGGTFHDWSADVIPWEDAPMDAQTFNERAQTIWSDD